MDWKPVIITIAALVFAGALLLTIIARGFDEAESNRHKVIEMTNTCVEAGYSGWDTYYGCIGGPGKN